MFTQKEIKEASLRIYDLLSKGASDKVIAKKLGLSAEEYSILKLAMFDLEAEKIRTKPVEHVYIEYLLRQEQNINTLSRVIHEYMGGSHPGAVVSAVKERANIIDGMLEKGQKMGVLHVEPDKKMIVAGKVVAELSNSDLKRGITQLVGQMNNLIKGYGGEKDLLELPAPKDIYYGETVDITELTKAENLEKKRIGRKKRTLRETAPKGRSRRLPDRPRKGD